jgi:hypothetical protein
MSATEPVPTVADFLQAGAIALRTDLDPAINVRRGSAVDLTAGPAALAWAQEAARDRDLFRSVYTDSSSGAALEDRVLLRYGVPRIKATRGQGAMVLQRANDLAGGGTIYEGTRISVQRTTSTTPLYYSVAEDYVVPGGAGQLSITVKIQATRAGSGVAINKPTQAAFEDVVYDPLWRVMTLHCGDGTDEESPEAYVARARTTKRDQRPGYRKRYEDVCKAAGAAYVVILDAGDLGEDNDFGVTHVYVGDAGYSATDALVNACSDAVDAVHIAGNDVQVLGMTPTPVTLSLTVKLWRAPGDCDTSGLRKGILSAVLAMFNSRPRFWLFDYDSIAGEAHAVGDDVQSVTVVSSPTPPSAAFVAVLPRYTLAAPDVTIAFEGPF